MHVADRTILQLKCKATAEVHPSGLVRMLPLTVVNLLLPTRGTNGYLVECYRLDPAIHSGVFV